MLDRLRHEPLRSELGHWFDADGAAFADLRPIARKKLDHRDCLGAIRLVLDPGVDVFDVLAENDDVELAGILHRRRDALEVAHRSDTGVEVEDLAQRDVERTDAAADRRGQRSLDRDAMLANHAEGFFGEPAAGLVEGFLACQHLAPRYAALAARRFCN